MRALFEGVRAYYGTVARMAHDQGLVLDRLNRVLRPVHKSGMPTRWSSLPGPLRGIPSLGLHAPRFPAAQARQQRRSCTSARLPVGSASTTLGAPQALCDLVQTWRAHGPPRTYR